MNKRVWATATAGVVGLGIAACDKLPGTTTSGVALVTNAVPATPLPPVDIGAPLFAPADLPPPATISGQSNEAVVVNNCQVTVPYSENVPSKNDGKLYDIVTEVQPGELASLPPSEVFTTPVEPVRKYRKLKEGDTIVIGQMVAMLDDRVARSAFNGAKANQIAARLSHGASKDAVVTAISTVSIFKKLRDRGASSDLEMNQAEKALSDARKAEADALGALEKAGPELDKATITLQDHEIRATSPGVIKTIYKKPGESVKALEPVLQIQDQSRLRIEGQLSVQYLPRLKDPRKAKVIIEPAPRQAGVELVGHWLPITGVAVSKTTNKPLVVTASEDKTVRVWDRSVQIANLSHPAAVRAIACTGLKAELNLALSGCDDGQGRLWNLDELGEPKLLKERHQGRINAVAFSPDGVFCATADDRKIMVWDTATGAKKYEVESGHKGPISAVQFTPQAKLVSEARDRTLRIWSLGEKAAKLDKMIEYRAGSVPMLGVSADGSKVLFDQEKALHVLSMADQKTEGVLPAPTESSQFAAFAIFSPDGKLVLAGGTGDSPLQLWRAPAPGVRAQQIRRLALNASQPTCAAFSPDGSFAVTGSQDNRVTLWEMPGKNDVTSSLSATLTNLDRSIDSTDQRVKVWAEVPNTDGRLLPGDTVTMVIVP